jgi:hypothetical protein
MNPQTLGPLLIDRAREFECGGVSALREPALDVLQRIVDRCPPPAAFGSSDPSFRFS